jgi:hypothetical protein
MKRTVSAVVAVGAAAWLCAGSPSAFNISEHKYAGDRAAREAFANLEAKKPALKLAWMAPPFGKTAAERWVTRPAAKELALTVSGSGSTTAFADGDILLWVGDHTGYGPGWATFGDLVAMYGDHKAGVESLNAMPAGELHTLQYKARKGIDELTMNLLHLASMNSDHFSEHAVLSYRDRHKMALEYAKKAAVENDIKLLWRALHHEAYAAHALTDLFAPGHMMMDRRASAQGAEKFFDQVMGVSGFVEHVKAAGKLAGGATDGAVARVIHNCFNDGGVEAKTLELPTSGDAFREYLGDGHFFETGGKNDAQLDAIDAVRFSLETVLLAYAAILEKADAAGSGAARNAGGGERLCEDLADGLLRSAEEDPVAGRNVQCVVSGITVAKSNAGWTDLPSRATAVCITTSGSSSHPCGARARPHGAG